MDLTEKIIIQIKIIRKIHSLYNNLALKQTNRCGGLYVTSLTIRRSIKEAFSYLGIVLMLKRKNHAEV